MPEAKPTISRRDFINGLLVGAGGVLGGLSSRTLAAEFDGDGRTVFGGNHAAAFTVGHWLRDRRLVFGASRIEVKPSPVDSVHGTVAIEPDGGDYDVIILGTGMAGLATGVLLREQHSALRLLFLDANPTPGGNSQNDRSRELPVLASTGTAYATAPSEEMVKSIYRLTGVDWERHIVAAPFYSYFVDAHTPYANAGAKGWVCDAYDKGLTQFPYPPNIVRQLVEARADLKRWTNLPGAPTDPPDQSDPIYDYLDRRSFDDYLVRDKGWHPAVSDFYSRYTADALACSTKDCSAYAGIETVGAEYGPLFAYPGGNSSIAGKFIEFLHSDKAPSRQVRLRQAAIALRVDQSKTSSEVIYAHQQRFFRARAKAVVIATGAHSAQHLIGHLASGERLAAYQAITLAPVVAANVALRSAAPLLRLGLGYNQFWWGGKHFTDFVTADWVEAARRQRDRPTVLTFYGGNDLPPEAMPDERRKLLSTPFAAYEASLRDDLSRILVGTDFDFDRDVTALHLYRWGHGMIYPKVGSLFGKEHRLSAPRHLIRQRIGRICFAGQDTAGTPSIESAIGSAYLAAKDILSGLA